MEHIWETFFVQFSKCFSYPWFSFIITEKIETYDPDFMDMTMN